MYILTWQQWIFTNFCRHNEIHKVYLLNLLLQRDPFLTLCKQSRPRSGSSGKSCLIRVYYVCLWKSEISDPTLLDLISNSFALYTNMNIYLYNYTPRKLCLWWGILFSRCPCVRASVPPSVTFCFFNNLKSHCWIFIKPCKHVHICKTNTLDKKVRARGQFY